MTVSSTAADCALFCQHCHNPVSHGYWDKQAGPFCCQGCLAVYQLISLKGLGQYYQLKHQLPWNRPATSLNNKKQSYAHWDSEAFSQMYVKVLPKGEWELRLYLENIHCAACLWLMRQLPQVFTLILNSSLNFETSILTLKLPAGAPLSSIAQGLRDLGYTPHPLEINDEFHHLWAKERLQQIKKMAVAFACATNIMLLSVCLYAGAEGIYARFFSWASLMLSLPVYLYSASGLYRNAWAGVKQGKIAIDVLITFAFTLGGVWSAANVILGSDIHFFDSTTSFITLILFTRFLLKYEAHKVIVPGINLYKEASVQKWDEHSRSFIPAMVGALKIGERIRLEAGELVCVDAVIEKGQADLDEALLTGESTPHRRAVGEVAHAGSINLSEAIELKVLATDGDTHMGQILASMGRSQGLQLLERSDKIAQNLILLTLAIGALTVFYFWIMGDLFLGLSRALALFLVACPCSYALIAPLALNLAKGHLRKKGIFLLRPECLERWPLAKTIYFDKTGTLTLPRDKHNYRSGAAEVIKEVQQQGLRPVLLSGDALEHVQRCAQDLHIKTYHAHLDAEGKKKIVEDNPSAIFVGDGINDSLAMTEAAVSVSMKGNLSSITQNFDILCGRDDLWQIRDINATAHKTMGLIKRNYLLAFFYNLLGIFFVLCGDVPPLLAAILMPINSLALILSTLASRWRWK